MALKAIFGRRWVRGLGVAGAAAAGYVFGLTADRATAQLPGSQPPADKRVVAYVYGNVPVLREELGDFLIARGGWEKLDLLVNKKIIEVEAARRNVSVTPTEVEAGLADDLKSLGINKEDFVKHVLPRYGKTLFEWTEDVIKPKLLLGKMCHDRVKLADDDLRKAFDNKYGERRQAKVICWNRGDLKAAQNQWAEARKGEVEFDRIARQQADANLAGSAGLIAPVGMYPDVEDDKCTKMLFTLKQGEISQLFETPAGIMCIKCQAIVPPDKTVEFEKVRPAIEREVYEKKLAAEIPKYFGELKKVAQPNLLLKGPPSPKEFREGLDQGLNAIRQTVGPLPGDPAPGAGVPPMPVPAPVPPKP